MKVREIMAKPVVALREDDTLEVVARTMLDNNIGCVPVVDRKGELCGIITESDFSAKEKGLPFSTFRAPQVLGQWLTSEGVERIYEASRLMTARDIMNRNVVTVSEEQTVTEAVGLMLRHDINRIPVTSGRTPVGIVSRHDLLRMIYDSSSKSNPQ